MKAAQKFYLLLRAREALDLAKGWSFFPNIGHTVVTSFVLKKETTFKMK